MKNVNPLPEWQFRQKMLGRYLLWFLLLLLLIVFWPVGREARITEISYSEFKQQIGQDQIAEVTFRGQQISGRYKTSAQATVTDTTDEAGEALPRRFNTTLPSIDDPELMPLLEEHEVAVRAESTETVWWQQLLIGVLPWVLIIGVFLYLSYRMQQRMMAGGGPGGIFNFGKSRAKRFREEKTGVAFTDAAGLENAKRDLQEIVGYLKEPERYRKLGAKVPKGILLMGPPGTGKTLLAKAVAGEADVPFYSISGSEFVEMFVGVGASRVRDMFESAKKEAPAIIFIDEIDAVGRARGAGLGGGHDEREQTLNQILSEMDGFAPYQDVVVLAATNRPDVLDQALLRPGRFDRKVSLELPNRKARKQILHIHSRDVPLAEDIDLEKIADRCIGFSGADLENLINEAALLAGREGKQRVDMDILELARDKIVMGAERETLMDEDEKRVIAFHESGHALLAWLLPNAAPLTKVTIIPRGQSLGATEQTPEKERHNLKYSYLLDRIGVMLGGRIAEKIIFDEVSSGAEMDLKQATQLARRMVCRWGMSEKLGPVSFRRGDEHIFLGRELAQQQDFSEHSARLIDEEIQRLLSDIEAKDEKLLRKHRDKLEALARKLLQAETLRADEIERILQRAPQAA